MPLRASAPMSSEQLGQIVEGSASEVYVFSATTFAFLLVNRGARENLGYSAEEFRDLRPWTIKPEVDEASFRALIHPLLTGETPDLKFETVHQRKDGSLYDVAVHLQLLRSGDEEVFFAAIRDVTEERDLHRQLEAKAQELQQALTIKDTLLHEVNHRVKNSLQVVTALLQLQAQQAGDPTLRAALHEARNRVSVVASIHQRLYMTSQHNLVDVGELVEELAEQVVGHMDLGQRVTTRLDLQRGLTLTIDRGIPLALVLSEILSNCVKYAFPDERFGTISVNLNSSNGRMRVIVADDGVGLPGPFGESGKGGLGTKIIKALTQQVRGQLSVSSSARGTSFVIELPYEEGTGVS